MPRRSLPATVTAETHLVHMQVALLLEQMLFLSEAGARRAAAIVPIAVPIAADIARAFAMDIARAFATAITKAAITVSATVTAAMDTTTEAAFVRNMAQFRDHTSTIIIATHRSSLLELVDRVVVLDRGRIVADGPRDEVLQALKRNPRVGQTRQQGTQGG